MAKKLCCKITELPEHSIMEDNAINGRWIALKESNTMAVTETLGKISRNKKENWSDKCHKATEKKNQA
jgi:hypothetical protein